MIFIQVLRKNDINPNYGRQVELSKSFFEDFGWEADTDHDVEIHSYGTTIRTTFRVRGSQRGGDRLGVDCKEYVNENGELPLKDYLIKNRKFSVADVGNVFMIFEFLDSIGHEFNLYFTSSIKDKIVEYPDSAVDQLPHQIIYFGAPGTGKSYAIDKLTKGKKVFRTTFHPDSDYSTFVGAYKPIATDDVKNNRLQNNLSVSELQKLYAEYIGQTPRPTRPEITFASMYWYQLEHVSTADCNLIFTGSAATVITGEVPKGIAAGKSLASRIEKQTRTITYNFVPQAFIKAYVEAWRDLSQPVYLVIEEINRGNCAQIFGDIFQLLDRKGSGFSAYQIEADQDLQDYLREEFERNGIDDKAFAPIKNGEKMSLPPNLHIWATMNTSDQSLFPIDSAFKRRWDWRYVKISDAKKDWKIKADDTERDWWEFIQEINKRIATETSSDDKKLGYFFCKPKNDETVIDEETFVGKVVFYLWNDVFKDGDTSIFNVGDSGVASFDDFYTEDANGLSIVDPTAVKKFLINVMGEEKTETTE